VVGFMLQPLYSQGKSPWFPLDRRLGGFQSRSGRGGEKKNPQPPPGMEPQRLIKYDKMERTENLFQVAFPENKKITEIVSQVVRVPD